MEYLLILAVLVGAWTLGMSPPSLEESSDALPVEEQVEIQRQAQSRDVSVCEEAEGAYMIRNLTPDADSD